MIRQIPPFHPIHPFEDIDALRTEYIFICVISSYLCQSSFSIISSEFGSGQGINLPGLNGGWTGQRDWGLTRRKNWIHRELFDKCVVKMGLNWLFYP